MCPLLALPDNCIKITRTLALVQHEDELWAVCACSEALLVDYFAFRDMDALLLDFYDEHGQCKRKKERRAA